MLYFNFSGNLENSYEEILKGYIIIYRCASSLNIYMYISISQNRADICINTIP